MTLKLFPTARQSFRKTFTSSRGLILALLLLGTIAHVWILNGSFKTMDDEMSIVSNPDIKSFAFLGKIFTSSFFGADTYYRPLVHFSYMLEYRFVGLNPLFYHLTNLIIHLGNSVVLFFIFLGIFKKRVTSFCAAALFAVHPVHWEAVSNVAGRSILLCASGYFLALFFYVKPASDKKTELFNRGGSLLAFILSLLSKEAAVTFLFSLWSFEFLILKKPGRKTLWPAVLGRLAPYFILTLGYLALRRALGITNIALWPSVSNGVLGAATFLRASLTYLRLFIFPVDLHFDRAIAYFVTPADPIFGATIVTAAILVWGLWKYRARLSRKVRFFMTWFGITLLPAAQFVPLPAHFGYAAAAEHFLYIPSAGMTALMVLAGDYVFRRGRKLKMISRGTIRLTCAGFFVYLILIAAAQNLYSSQETAMFERSLSRNPHNTRVRVSYALALAKQGRFKEAEQGFRQVLAAEPWDARARAGLGKSLCDQGRCLEAIAEYEKISDAGNLKDLLMENLKDTYPIVIRQYLACLSQDPDNGRLHYSLGVMYAKMNNPGEAIRHYQKAVDLDPKDRYALFNLACGLHEAGELSKAGVYFKRLIALSASEDEFTEYARRHLAEIRADKRRGRVP